MRDQSADEGQTPEFRNLPDLLPVGIMMCSSRIILYCNAAFAGTFGYRPQELLGKSLELLYPSSREFVDIGDRWLEIMRSGGECGDERIMRCKDNSLVWFRVKGRCRDKRDPFALVGCTFESLRQADGITNRLTPREREIIAAIAEGLTSKEIARLLKLSPRTVETYRSRLMEKLRVKNTSELLSNVLGGRPTPGVKHERPGV